MAHESRATPPTRLATMIGPAHTEDLAAVFGLLEQSGLPKDGLADHIATTLVARDGGQIVGGAALELYGTAALLRSVAVEPERRGQGLGQRLTQAALDLARQRGVRKVYHLTETADGFFTRFGFGRVARTEVPLPVQQSVEFTRACPVTAQAMALHVRAEDSR